MSACWQDGNPFCWHNWIHFLFDGAFIAVWVQFMAPRVLGNPAMPWNPCLILACRQCFAREVDVRPQGEQKCIPNCQRDPTRWRLGNANTLRWNVRVAQMAFAFLFLAPTFIYTDQLDLWIPASFLSAWFTKLSKNVRWAIAIYPKHKNRIKD